MASDSVKSRDRGRTQSVQRALMLLEAVGSQAQEIGIVDLSHRVGLPVSTVHRLLATLVDAGFVVQHPDTGRYRIGVRTFELGNAFLKQTQLLDIVRPGMRQLGNWLGETVNLAIRDGHTAVYVDQQESDHPLKIFTRRGTRVPLYCTGIGKVFLAGLTEPEIDAYLARTALTPRTHATITSPVRLRHQLQVIRDQGYAVDNEDFERGVRCIAAPIHDHVGETVAALSVSGPAHRFADDQLPLMISKLTETTAAISAQLGLKSAT